MTPATAHRLVRWVIIAAMLLAGATIGAATALRVDGPHQRRTSLATLNLDVHLSTDPRFELYVPLVDWRVVINAVRSPLAIVVETRAIDRDAARRAIAPNGAQRQLRILRTESREVLIDSLRRAAFIAVLGGAAGGALAGSVVGLFLLRRRFVPIGAAAGTALAIGGVLWCGAGLRDLDTQSLRGATFAGRAAELPTVLAFSQQLLHVGSDYERLYERALNSLDNLRAFSRRDERLAESTLLLTSDIHNNEFVLDAFDEFAGQQTVLLAGDYGQVGARVEKRLAPMIARLGGQVVAVSGNHDSTSFMEALSDHGVTVLEHDPAADGESDRRSSGEVVVSGLRVRGYSDPLARDGDERHVLRVYGSRYEAQVDDLIEWYDSLESAPDVLLIHQHGLAARLLRHLVKNPDHDRLIVLTGHSHRPTVKRYAKHLLVDAGTLGAGGPFAIGEQEASFAQLQLRDGRVSAVDIVRVDPISGSASRTRREL